LWVIDLGIGGLTSKQSLTNERTGTMTRALRGAHTPVYASPQQKAGQAADPRDDVHALGVVWYQLTTGQTSEGPGVHYLEELGGQGMPAAWIEHLRTCVHPRAEKRPADGTAMAEAMERWFVPPKAKKSEKFGIKQILVTVAILFMVIAIPLMAVLSNKGTPVSSKLAIEPRAATLPARFTNSIGMKFTKLPGGTFKMGSPANVGSNDEQPVRDITIDAFHMGVYEVRQAEFARFQKENPSYFRVGGGGEAKLKADTDTADFPVDSVNYDVAVKFIGWLNDLPEEIAAGRMYRLPTEAEWEYASQGPAASPAERALYGQGIFAPLTATNANFSGNLGRTCKVGSYPANAFGLYDMQGNVWEWCHDWFGPYDPTKTNNPQGPPNGNSRVLRGGSWDGSANNCRCSYRGINRPVLANDVLGFRVACVPRTVR